MFVKHPCSLWSNGDVLYLDVVLHTGVLEVDDDVALRDLLVASWTCVRSVALDLAFFSTVAYRIDCI